MKILAVGGGSGGHVTPVAAVLRELKKKSPDNLEIRFWCDRKFLPQARGIISSFDESIPVESIFSGKLRRYHGVSWWYQTFHPKIFFPNLRDVFLILIGFIQSMVKLVAFKPDVVFTKGGFVCLPVGIAAKILNIPLVIHDSDAHPGLTNKVLSRFATSIATGSPLEYYPYPKSRSKYVGVPIADHFQPFSDEQRFEAKKSLGFEPNRPLTVVTGGGLGAKLINDAVAANLGELLEFTSVILISGTLQFDELSAITPGDRDDAFQLHAFVDKDMHKMLGAADVVVARAGATTILELAALKTPTILIPNAKLTGDHQTKNAAVYAKSRAVEILDEKLLLQSPSLISQAVRKILSDPESAKQMATRFHVFARPKAASDMAEMIIEAAKH